MPTWKVMNCRGKDCGAEIVFLTTTYNKQIPVNYTPETVLALDTHYIPGRHVPHHSTCPNANDFRKGKRGRAR